MPNLKHAIYASLAAVSFALGVIGLFLPVMPTTGFMLLAVWLASRGSPRFAHWIRRHPRFGPPILAWEDERAIPRHAKWMAATMLVVSSLVIGFTVGALVVRLGLIVGLFALGLWIITRPEPRGACPFAAAADAAAQRRLDEASCASRRSGL